MSTWKVLLWDGGRQARAKMRDGWPGANCHPDVFEQSIFSVCFSVPWDLVSFDWEHIACPCFPCLHWTADFPTGWVLETRWLMKFALVRTASCSILSNWSREKKMRLIILLADTTPSEKKLWTLSWTESESWLITALVACFGTKTCVFFCLWASNNNILFVNVSSINSIKDSFSCFPVYSIVSFTMCMVLCSSYKLQSKVCKGSACTMLAVVALDPVWAAWCWSVCPWITARRARSLSQCGAAHRWPPRW